MKVCVISHSAVVAGYREKFHRLADFGMDIHLALPAGWPENNQWIAAPKPGYEKGIDLSIFPVNWAGKVGGFFLPGLKKWIEKLQPDILHLEEAPFALVGAQALRAHPPRKPKILFLTWENIFRRYKFPLSWANRWMLSTAHWAIAGSHEAQSILRQRGFRGEVSVIPQYGVNPNVFFPEPARKKKSAFTVGFFGRLLEEKGIHTLLRAVALLKFPVQLIITGQGPYESALRSQVSRLAMQDKVIFKPAVPYAGMPDAMRALDVLVLPSETRRDWKEQFGRVLIEAMACGVTVVGSNSGEIPHVIGEAGLIFPESDAPALARLLAMLHDSPAWSADLAQRGRARVLAEFTTDRIARQTLEVYQSMAGR